MKLTALYIISVALAFCSCERRTEFIATKGDPTITCRTFLSDFGGYGYDILVRDTVVIHQPHIPVFNENLGFPTEASARQVAELVISKMKNKESPPSVTREELIKFSLSE
jgi:hypothetical protein